MANITGQTYNVTGLSVATSYTFEVLAVNDQGIAPNNHAAEVANTTGSVGTYVYWAYVHWYVLYIRVDTKYVSSDNNGGFSECKMC